MTDPGVPAEATRCGFVAVLGAPNAGKSTLINRIVGAKVSIVSPKVQTTRARVRGIAAIGGAQLILTDTPGIFAPRRRLDRAMVAAAWTEAGEADRIVLLVDARHWPDPDVDRIVGGLKDAGRTATLVLNKVDAIKPERLLPIAKTLNDTGLFEETFMISALTGEGVEDLQTSLAAAMPDGPWLFPEDQLTDMNDRLFAAEITREKLFLHLRQELPYALTVETENWDRFEDGSVRIEQTVYVERDSQKAIVLGKGGARIRKVGEAARQDLEEAWGHKVHLFLFVKVREKWGDDPERYRVWGLDFDV